MFGYLEPAYTILDDFSHPSAKDADITVYYELREPQTQQGRSPSPVAPIPYIAVWRNKAGQDLSDVLYCYDSAESARGDWEKLIGPEVVMDAQLAYSERIDYHHTGRRRDGGIVLY